MAAGSSSGGGGGGGVPPGFRFHPTDEELLHFYLKKKISFQKFDMEVIREVDLNKIEPWDLQEKCKIGSTPQNEWYFFSHKDRKYPTGSRTNRATSAGFWKATGRDKCIRNSFKKIGMRKTLVFYRGRAPHGQKTDWIMHEYRLEDSSSHDHNELAQSPDHHEDGWVVCRVFKKKNLFKVGNNNTTTNSHEGHSSGIMMIDHHQQQQLNMSSTTSGGAQSRSPAFFTHSSSNTNLNQYMLQTHGQQSLHSDHHNHHLNYSHIPLPPHHHQYPLQLVEPHNFISTHDNNIIKPLMLNTSTNSNYDHLHLSATTADNYDHHQSPSSMSMQVKQFMSSNANTSNRDHDCAAESASDPSAAANYQPCDQPGIHEECDQAAMVNVIRSSDDHQNMNEWDRLVVNGTTSTSHHHHHDQADNSNHDPPSSINQINQLSLRSEMDFWAYNPK